MLNYKKDFEITNSIIKRDYYDEYDKLYFSSNENLKDIFHDMDFTGKKVLTVLASGDQAFHFYDHNATEVDLFDKNKLTLYYFYLRIWFIEIENKYDITLSMDNTTIIKLLKEVNPKTAEEKEAYKYWKEYFKKYFYMKYALLNLQGEKPNRKNIIDNLDKIKSSIKGRNFNFYNINLASKHLKLNKKYDVIYTSNIIDWLFYDLRLYEIYAKNLNNLLEDDGLIICSDLNREGACKYELDIMEKYFEYKALPNKNRKILSYDASSPGYTYKKKKGQKS